MPRVAGAGLAVRGLGFNLLAVHPARRCVTLCSHLVSRKRLLIAYCQGLFVASTGLLLVATCWLLNPIRAFSAVFSV